MWHKTGAEPCVYQQHSRQLLQGPVFDLQFGYLLCCLGPQGDKTRVCFGSLDDGSCNLPRRVACRMRGMLGIDIC